MNLESAVDELGIWLRAARNARKPHKKRNALYSAEDVLTRIEQAMYDNDLTEIEVEDD